MTAGSTVYLCVCCETQGRKPYFRVEGRELDRRGGISCPSCGSRGVSRSPEGQRRQIEKNTAAAINHATLSRIRQGTR